MAKMGFSKEQLTKKLTPGGIYDFHFSGFKPAPKNGTTGTETVNLNPQLKIINSKDFTGVPVFLSLPQSQGWMIQDFVHSLGQEMDHDGNLPGDWEFPVQDNPTTWRYRGPLVGKTGKVELIETTYNGKPQLKVKQLICAVKDCKTKNPEIVHSSNMAKG
jgi:hypothetical protein